MTEFVRRPGVVPVVPDEERVWSSRPYIGTTTPDDTPTAVPTDDEWHARLRRQLAEATERRERTKALRAQLAAARNAGKAARHARRLEMNP